MHAQSLSMTATDLAEIIGTPASPVIVDVRRRQAFDEADRVIAGARWRDHRIVEDWAPTLPESAEVLIYCVHGHQVSQVAAARLRALGVHARFLEGGIEAYAAAGGITLAKPESSNGISDQMSRWVTRERPGLQSLACAWFIRRFVDPQAELLPVGEAWLTEVAEEAGATVFGQSDWIENSEAAFRDSESTLDCLGIRDRALQRLAEALRNSPAPGTRYTSSPLGLPALVEGLLTAYPDDRTVLAHALILFDSLLAWARSQDESRPDRQA